MDRTIQITEVWSPWRIEWLFPKLSL